MARFRWCSFILVFVMALFIYQPQILGADLDQTEINQIKQAITNIVSSNAGVKGDAIKLLQGYGQAAFPYYIEQMQRNQGETVFIAYELLDLAGAYGEEALPVIQMGLKDANPAARNRAVKMVNGLGPKAAALVDDVARIAADTNEAANIRSQAVDALLQIGVVSPAVTKGLALALTGDSMTAWKVSTTVKGLNISYDTLLALLFDQLETDPVTFGSHNLLTAISRNIKLTTAPLDILKEELANPSFMLQRNLSQFILDVYPALSAKADEFLAILFQLAVSGSSDIKEQIIYALGELGQGKPEITERLVELLSTLQPSDEDYLFLAYALEKSEPDYEDLISLFTGILLDSNSTRELQLVAARYLEKCTEVSLVHMQALLGQVEFFDEDVLWRLSPMFYHAVQANPEALDLIQEQAGQAPTNLYCTNLLAVLGDTEPVAISPANQVPDRLVAFPGAEGYGAYTVGGRGGTVYVVTNLNDKGPGSLRAAVEAPGPRTVVFAVSGNIMLTDRLVIENPYITIDGQTAPGEGVTIAGAPLVINTNQVIIRYIRARLGDYNNFESDAIEGRYVSDIILDHVSASWSTDETVSFYVVDNLTVQWSFITESLRGSVHVKGNHGYGGIWGGSASYHHNLMAHHSSRTPRFDGERTLADPAVDMRNNVIYNWGFNSAYGGEGGNHNLVANYYKAGPGTGKGSVSYRIVEVSNGGKWYVADNFVYGATAISADNWAGGVQFRNDRAEDVKHDTEFPVPPVTTQAAVDAYQSVLSEAGCTLPARDEIDKRIVGEVIGGTATYGGAISGLKSGIIDTQDNVGGLTFLRSFSSPRDSDASGIPDWWAIKYGFSPMGGLDPLGDPDNDGYTNIEEYLNGTNPLVAEVI